MEKELNKEIKELLNWTPEGVDLKAIGKINYPERHFPKEQYGEIVTDEDCKAPFFSEAYLYPLLGKMDARTLLCLLERAFKSVEINMEEKKMDKEEEQAIKIICMVRNKDNKHTDWCETRLIDEIVKIIK